MGINVTVGIQDILGQAGGSPGSNSIQLRAEERTLAINLVSGRTVVLEECLPSFEVGIRLFERGLAPGDELVETTTVLAEPGAG